MVSTLVSGSSGPGSNPGRGHCVEILVKTLYSHSVSKCNLMLEVTLPWTSIATRGGAETFLVASCYN